MFFFILIALATGSWFIQYPDIVQARARINSINAPKEVITKISGRLFKLFKGDSSDVKRGEIIGYMESTASHDEVLKLSLILDTIQYFTDSNRLEEIPGFWNPSNQSFAHLGELQQAHQTFMQGYITFKDYLNSGFYVSKKKMLNRDLENTKQLLETLQEQLLLQQQDLDLTAQNYNIHDTLHRETLISDLDYRNQKSQLINKKMSIPQTNASIISNRSQQKALFVQLLNTYKNTIEDWKQKYLVIAPVAGKLYFTVFLEENQQLQTNQVIGYIINESNRYYVEMLIPQTNLGKVKQGQEVLMKFPSYPSQEYGSVKGRIEYIKNIPVDSGYLARVILPYGLITNYKKTIFFKEGLVAQAEIITEKKRLSDRFMNGFKNLIK
jgi:HlyD family secretion protein